MKKWTFIEVAILTCVVAILLASGLVYWDVSMKLTCYQHGYPRHIGSYCVRLEHGTEVMVPVKSLQ